MKIAMRLILCSTLLASSVCFGANDFSSIELNVSGPKDTSPIFPSSMKRFVPAQPTVTKTAFVSLCAKKDVADNESFRKNCVTIYSPNFVTTAASNGQASGYPNIHNFLGDVLDSKTDLKEIVRMAFQKKIRPDTAVLVINYVSLEKKDVYVGGSLTSNITKVTDNEDLPSFLFPVYKMANLHYKIYHTQVIDIFKAPMNKNISNKNDDGFSVGFKYVPNDEKTNLFNLPASFLQSRITNQIFPGVLSGRVRDYLALTVAFNLTRYHKAWSTLADLLKNEHTTKMVEPLGGNPIISQLSKDKTINAVLRENESSLINMYIAQTVQLKNEVAESKLLDIQAPGLTNVASALPEFRGVYVTSAPGNSPLSAQDQLAKYTLYKNELNDTIAGVSAVGELGSSVLESMLQILR